MQNVKVVMVGDDFRMPGSLGARAKTALCFAYAYNRHIPDHIDESERMGKRWVPEYVRKDVEGGEEEEEKKEEKVGGRRIGEEE